MEDIYHYRNYDNDYQIKREREHTSKCILRKTQFTLSCNTSSQLLTILLNMMLCSVESTCPEKISLGISGQ